ncbi:UNVERIFIED_CONTAM: hypothetical protein Slati_1754500 [Sesamum latifolium]|uniref:Uncharacterized protein n=1 Tax=Sesamum latifolium TaxID=2727402 RepID=A0AAW2WZM6_9LAMI
MTIGAPPPLGRGSGRARGPWTWPSHSSSRRWCRCTPTIPTTGAYIRAADHDYRSRQNWITCCRAE